MVGGGREGKVKEVLILPLCLERLDIYKTLAVDNLSPYQSIIFYRPPS